MRSIAITLELFSIGLLIAYLSCVAILDLAVIFGSIFGNRGKRLISKEVIVKVIRTAIMLENCVQTSFRNVKIENITFSRYFLPSGNNLGLPISLVHLANERKTTENEEFQFPVTQCTDFLQSNLLSL